MNILIENLEQGDKKSSGIIEMLSNYGVEFSVLPPVLPQADVRYQLAISALEKIKDPIARMKQELKEDEELNGYYAVQLSNDAHYLRSIAEQGLDAIANCT